MSNPNKIDPQIPKLTLPNLTNTLLLGNSTFIDKINTLILDGSNEYILSTKRFDDPFLSQINCKSIYGNLYHVSF